MVLKRPKPGSKKISARLLRGAAAAAEDYQNTRELSTAINPKFLPIPTDLIKVKNDCGANRLRGDVLELVGLQTSSVDPSHLWLTGDTPTAPGQPFAVLRRATPNGSIDDGQVSGVCMARVNVSNADHNYADLASSAHELASGTSGPAHILYKPSGTGIKECVVNLSNPRRVEPLRYLILFGINGTYASMDLINFVGGGSGGPNEHQSDPVTDGSGDFDFNNTDTVTVKRRGMYRVSLNLSMSGNNSGSQGQAMSVHVLRSGTSEYDVWREQVIILDSYGVVVNYTTENLAMSQPLFLAVNDTVRLQNRASCDVVLSSIDFSLVYLGEVEF